MASRPVPAYLARPERPQIGGPPPVRRPMKAAALYLVFIRTRLGAGDSPGPHPWPLLWYRQSTYPARHSLAHLIGQNQKLSR